VTWPLYDGGHVSSPLFRLRDLRVDRGGRRVLEVGELDLAGGQLTAVVGPNGAGKTTLLRVLAGVQSADGGTLLFGGRAVDPATLRRDVTLVAQTPFLFHRSVRANVAFGLHARGLVDDGRVGAALDAVGLQHLTDRPAWKLSGGEAQRVAVARALAIDPPVYLFDEPTANVDREYVAVIEDLIAALAARGRNVVLTSHRLEQAYRLGERVLSMVGGRIVAPPLVNVLRGRPVSRGTETGFESGGLEIELPPGASAHTVAIDPDHILVSRTRITSSARNCFAGRIVRAVDDDRGILVTVDCGRPLVARVTRHSYDELGLNIGAEVYVTFKSSAVHILDEP